VPVCSFPPITGGFDVAFDSGGQITFPESAAVPSHVAGGKREEPVSETEELDDEDTGDSGVFTLGVSSFFCTEQPITAMIVTAAMITFSVARRFSFARIIECSPS
jgi:hypothetical protein